MLNSFSRNELPKNHVRACLKSILLSYPRKSLPLHLTFIYLLWGYILYSLLFSNTDLSHNFISKWLLNITTYLCYLYLKLLSITELILHLLFQGDMAAIFMLMSSSFLNFKILFILILLYYLCDFLSLYTENFIRAMHIQFLLACFRILSILTYRENIFNKYLWKTQYYR